MTPHLISIITNLIVGGILTIITLRALFNNNILFIIGLIWVSSLFINNIRIQLLNNLEADTKIVSFQLAVLITAFLAYHVYRLIRKPYYVALKNFKEFSRRNLGIGINKNFPSRKGELGSLSNNVLKISQTFTEIIPEIENSAKSNKELGTTNTRQINGVNKVIYAMQYLKDVIQQNVVSSKELVSNTKKLGAEVKELADLISFFNTGDLVK